jgi:hypothetical protein
MTHLSVTFFVGYSALSPKDLRLSEHSNPPLIWAESTCFGATTFPTAISVAEQLGCPT